MRRPVIAPSARKHGIADVDILHAYRNPIRRFELDDGLTLLVGPDHAARLLEVGVVAGDPDPVIVHAMACRERFWAERNLTGGRRERDREQRTEVITMPRKTEEILDHADELAHRFEDYEPRPGDAVEITALRLVGGAVARRAAAERELVQTVRQAREAGQSWAAIGAILGTSGEAARQRYGR